MPESRFLRRHVLLGLVPAFLACSISDDDPKVQMPRAQRFCEPMCRRANACNAQIDIRICTDYCVANPGSIPFLRDDVVDLLGECMQRTSCVVILGDESTSQCFVEAEAKIAPSAGAVAYCKAIAEPEFECGYQYHPSECAQAVKLWDDSFLQGIQYCASESTCAAYDACFERGWNLE